MRIAKPLTKAVPGRDIVVADEECHLPVLAGASGVDEQRHDGLFSVSLSAKSGGIAVGRVRGARRRTAHVGSSGPEREASRQPLATAYSTAL